MSYEALQETGLTQECFTFCPTTQFSEVAVQVEQARTDVELAEEIGVSATGMALLLNRLDGLLNPVCKAATTCRDGGPWRYDNNKIECGTVSGVVVVDTGRNGAGVTRFNRDQQ